MAVLGIVVVLLLVAVLAITLMGIFGTTTTITHDE
jgi:hypothetical protein